MLKKLFLSLSIISLFVFTQTTYAQDATSPTPSPTSQPKQTKQASSSATVKYDLAFPGMLPDNPLYKLKVLRDRVMLYFTTDPQQKINFYLLQTDKGILASAMLVDKGEDDLAAQTALKAENNYTDLANEMGNLPHKPDKPFFDKLYTAAAKHQAVLTNLSKRTSGNDKKIFEDTVDFSKRNEQSIKYYQEQI